MKEGAVSEAALFAMSNEQFRDAVGDAIKRCGNLTRACESNGWKYHRVYGRLRGMGKRCPYRGQSVLVDAY